MLCVVGHLFGNVSHLKSVKSTLYTMIKCFVCFSSLWQSGASDFNISADCCYWNKCHHELFIEHHRRASWSCLALSYEHGYEAGCDCCTAALPWEMGHTKYAAVDNCFCCNPRWRYLHVQVETTWPDVCASYCQCQFMSGQPHFSLWRWNVYL